jgi:DNA-binding ferritin-like protein
MADDQLMGQALIELADYANCVSGDFHSLHFNIEGADFDTMHKKVLKQYYEEAAEDFDELCEKARMFGITVPNPNRSAERLEYESQVPESVIDRNIAIERTMVLLECLIGKYMQVYKVFNKMDDCAISVGIANYLQTRIEYWSKECYYFNKSRG